MLRLSRLAPLSLVALVSLAACSSSDDVTSRRAELADGCNINSDCAEPLVCAYRKCHTACEVTRDCPTGQRCMASDRPFHVCQLPSEQRCAYNSQCPQSQVCGTDGECRDQCTADRDCVAGQRCVTGTCAEPAELDADGRLPTDADANPTVSGQPCDYSSDCAPPFVCRGGLCAYECLEDRDCKGGRTCTAHRCGARVCGGLDAGVAGGQSCTFNSQCDAPLVCRAGQCDCQCIADADCPADEACSGWRCVPGGSGDAGADGSTDAGKDGSTDAGKDGSTDAGVDSSVSPDGGAEGGVLDASLDVPVTADAGAEPLAPPATSCLVSGPGLTDCGDSGSGAESCCTRLFVTGGTFNRDYDGVTKTDASWPATVSDLQLDKYEVTVGRFRRFVAAWTGGYRPSAGDGKHLHVNGGAGLKVGGNDETGWDSSWDAKPAADDATWSTNLSCSSLQTWTAAPGSGERLPIDCVTWYEAYAFCIWDGGFLPSEAEWNYAAAGGSEHRVLPWSSPPGDSTIDCAHANYQGTNGYCSGSPATGAANAVGAESPLGNGRYGQADLAGNLAEWVGDSYFFQHQVPCIDCAWQDYSGNRWVRGGAFFNTDLTSSTGYRLQSAPSQRSYGVGFRCARVPKNAP